METIRLICQVVVALGILNVWLLRPRKATGYRGGSATNMTEEFAVYGLPRGFMITIGCIKVSLALLLIAGIWMPQLVRPAAAALALLMAAAVGMHLKVKDPARKSLPALSVLVLSLIVALG